MTVVCVHLTYAEINKKIGLEFKSGTIQTHDQRSPLTRPEDLKIRETVLLTPS